MFDESRPMEKMCTGLGEGEEDEIQHWNDCVDALLGVEERSMDSIFEHRPELS